MIPTFIAYGRRLAVIASADYASFVHGVRLLSSHAALRMMPCGATVHAVREQAGIRSI